MSVLWNRPVLGGTVFFTTFVGTDFCTALGDGRLYALFYRSGSAYFVSSVGTSTQGSNTVVNQSVLLQVLYGRRREYAV